MTVPTWIPRRTPPAGAWAWWWDAIAVGALAIVAAIGSWLISPPWGAAIAILCFGGAYVTAKSAGRKEFQRGWRRGYVTAISEAGDVCKRHAPEVYTRLPLPPAVTPEPWDPFNVDPPWANRAVDS